MTGNPVREEFYHLTKEAARRELGIRPDERILFATGGSLGAKTINRTIMDLVKKPPDLGYRVISGLRTTGVSFAGRRGETIRAGP